MALSVTTNPGPPPLRERLASAVPVLGRADRPHLVAGAVILVLGVAVLPAILSQYWLDQFIQVAVYAVVALGLGVLVGRVGMFSLGQIAVLAVGSWTAARLDYATTLPFPVVLLAGGVVAGIFGIVVGLPALRLTGLDLALVTLMLAGAATIVFDNINFPNGGHGFTGYTSSPFGNPPVRRPSVAASNPAYLRYAVVIAVLMFLLVLWHLRSKPGRAWAAIRQSEAAAMASGINITFYKLWAFALASFVTGIAGGVLAASASQIYNTSFLSTPLLTQGSIELMAVVLVGGVFTIWGAVVAGVLLELVPAVLNGGVWNLSPYLAIILFGVGVIQVLSTAPKGIASQMPQDLKHLAGALARLVRARGRVVEPAGAGVLGVAAEAADPGQPDEAAVSTP